ncbi:unnamed protein product, partial [Meganyctiphanes norvegica]
MGLWGKRGDGHHKKKEKRRGHSSRSGSYSDDYRITPELQMKNGHKHGGHIHNSNHKGLYPGDERCCSRDGGPCCSEDEYCCSQDIRAYSPIKPHPDPPIQQRRSRSSSGSRRNSMLGGMGIVVMDGNRVDVRRHSLAPSPTHLAPSPTQCLSCASSCDTCSWSPAMGPVTQIPPMKNSLFTSPMALPVPDIPYDPVSYDEMPYELLAPYPGKPFNNGSPTRGHSPVRRYTASEGQHSGLIVTGPPRKPSSEMAFRSPTSHLGGRHRKNLNSQMVSTRKNPPQPSYQPPIYQYSPNG